MTRSLVGLFAGACAGFGAVALVVAHRHRPELGWATLPGALSTFAGIWLLTLLIVTE